MRKNIGLLPVFIVVLAMGLCVRFAEFSSAVAEDKPPAEEKLKESDAVSASKAEAAPPETAAEPVVAESSPPEDDLNDSEIDVLRQLADRRRALDAREKGLDQREAMLKAAQSEISQKYGELDKLRGEIKQLLDIQSEQEEKRLASLVKVYEGMKPQAAATIFNTLDLEVLMQVMGRMSDRKLSPILAAMDPNRAREITINLAMQKKLPDAAPAAGAIDPAAAAAKANAAQAADSATQ